MVQTGGIWQKLKTIRKKRMRKIQKTDKEQNLSSVYLQSISKLNEFLWDVKVPILCDVLLHSTMSLSQNSFSFYCYLDEMHFTDSMHLVNIFPESKMSFEMMLIKIPIRITLVIQRWHENEKEKLMSTSNIFYKSYL